MYNFVIAVDSGGGNNKKKMNNQSFDITQDPMGRSNENSLGWKRARERARVSGQAREHEI